uniref:Regulatory protein zeste n=1 Tax=Pararge aegeria TaxID=116150 RepID=S4P2E3_9NEOP
MEHKIIKKKFIRSTNAQIKLLLNYMATNKTFANGRLFGPLENLKEKQWNSLRVLLRKYGPDKSVRQWKTTWRDLKRKMRVQKSDVKKMADTINVNKDYIAPDLSDELHRPLEHKPFTDSDPLESNFNGSSMQNFVSIKQEPSTCASEFPSINDIKSNPEAFNSISNPSCSHNSSIPLSFHTHSYSKPSSLNTSSNQFHEDDCSHQNILSDIISLRSETLQTQNVLLQNLSNLMEERNSILRMRNSIERNKIRYQYHRRF